MGLDPENHWSSVILARVISGYATSFLDLAQLVQVYGRDARSHADELRRMAVQLETIAVTIRHG